MRSNVRLLTRGSLALLIGLGCYPERGTETTSYDSVFTVYDTTTNWAAASTFSLADSVVHLTEPGDPDTLSHQFDDEILARIRANMIAAGYTEVPGADTAHFNVLAMVGAGTFTGYYWDYWCSYYGWYYPAWGCYYPPYWYSYEIQLGALLIGIVDNRLFLNQEAPMVWAAMASGVAGSGATVPRLNQVIDQAFEQSPYIDNP